MGYRNQQVGLSIKQKLFREMLKKVNLIMKKLR